MCRLKKCCWKKRGMPILPVSLDPICCHKEQNQTSSVDAEAHLAEGLCAGGRGPTAATGCALWTH